MQKPDKITMEVVLQKYFEIINKMHNRIVSGKKGDKEDNDDLLNLMWDHVEKLDKQINKMVEKEYAKRN